MSRKERLGEDAGKRANQAAEERVHGRNVNRPPLLNSLLWKTAGGALVAGSAVLTFASLKWDGPHLTERLAGGALVGPEILAFNKSRKPPTLSHKEFGNTYSGTRLTGYMWSLGGAVAIFIGAAVNYNLLDVNSDPASAHPSTEKTVAPSRGGAASRGLEIAVGGKACDQPFTTYEAQRGDGAISIARKLHRADASNPITDANDYEIVGGLTINPLDSVKVCADPRFVAADVTPATTLG